MLRLLARLARDDSGATAIEYGLIAALVSATLVGTLSILGFPSLYSIFIAVYDLLAASLSG